MGFLKYEPPGYAERQERWPLLLFLHGAGESGDDPQELLSEGATGCPLVELQKGTAVPVLRDSFVVVAPQTNVGWDAERISAFTDAIASDESQFRIDPSRMYCTGVSMGGYGAWQAGTLGGKFAAIAPVCGAGGVSAASLGSTPVWAFHGANDVVVPVHATDGMVQRLRALRFGGNANAAEGEGAGGIGGGGRGRGGRRGGAPQRGEVHAVRREPGADRVGELRWPRELEAGVRRPGTLRLAPGALQNNLKAVELRQKICYRSAVKSFEGILLQPRVPFF
jgi:predicted esterase